MEDKSLAEQAKVRYASAGRRGKRIHYSPSNDETLCGKVISEYLNIEHVVALLNKDGYGWCINCDRAAERRVEALAASVKRHAEDVEAHVADVRQLAAEVNAFSNEVAVWGTEVDAVCEPAAGTETVAESGQVAVEFDVAEIVDAIRNSKHRDRLTERARSDEHGFGEAVAYYAYGLHSHEVAAVDWAKVRTALLSTEQATPAGEQHVVEGVIVEHAGTAEGCAPRDVTHPDVVAAREALAGLAVATLTDHHDFCEPTEDERDVRGYVINPRGQGRVALYWLEGGKNVRRDVMPHGPALDCLADRMTRRGWTVEKMLRSSQCVFAHRPVEDTLPAEAQPAAPAELPAGADLDDTCLHGKRPRPDVSGDPITWCARKQANQSAGVWNDEGCVLAVDCCVEAANDCAQYNVGGEAPAGDPEFLWALMCTQHEEQMLDTCEECNAVPAEDRCKECSGTGCHWCHWTGEQQPEQALAEAETVEQPAADGTWRGGWIASTPPQVGDELFDLDQGEGEQGALFE